jgi:hypothetical protein
VWHLVDPDECAITEDKDSSDQPNRLPEEQERKERNMKNPTRDSQWSRGKEIIAAVCRHLAFEEARVLGRRRDPETVEVRQLACYVLERGGYRPAHIGILLQRTHGAIVHALHRVEHSPALRRAGQRLAQEVLPSVGLDLRVQPADSVPITAVSRALAHTLPRVASPQEVRAVRAYVCGTLLGSERVPGVQAAWGLWVFASQPRVRAVVEDVLDTWGLPAHAQLIELHLRQAGLR